MDKKISSGCFRPLNENETRILLMRHGAHKNNVLTPEAIAQARVTGGALNLSGIDITVAYSSPSPRALETNLNVQHGYGKMCYIHTDHRIADMSGDPEAVKVLGEIKKRVEARGLVWGDPGIAQVAYDPNENFLALMEKRAADGDLAIESFIFDNESKTVLVTSHGVAMIEATLMSLSGKKIHIPERLAETCQIIELILKNESGYSGKRVLVEENWLEAIPAPTAPKPPTT